MNDIDDNQRVGIGKWSLTLFVVGLLLPLLALARSQSHHPAVAIAIGVVLIAEGLALAFGILGRKHLYGRVGMIGAMVVMGLVVVLMVGAALVWCPHRNKTVVNEHQKAVMEMQNSQPIPASHPSTAP